VFHTLRSHSALGELSKSGRIAVECQKARLVQAPLIPAPCRFGSAVCKLENWPETLVIDRTRVSLKRKTAQDVPCAFD
jgi:hypothetical protein